MASDEGKLSSRSGSVDELSNLKCENDIMTKEKDLAEYEVDLLRRETEVLKFGTGKGLGDGQLSQESLCGGPIDNEERCLKSPDHQMIAELLGNFDGQQPPYHNWVRQYRLLEETHNLDETTGKFLLNAVLKGRALQWFHSLPDYVEASVDYILTGLKDMFDLRPGKLTMRNKFGDLKWKVGESFVNYYHEKLNLANNMLMDRKEIMDYLIEGIPDDHLRDQARIKNFRDKSDLLAAFSKITLREPLQQSWKKYIDNGDERMINETNVSNQLFSDFRRKKGGLGCYNCGEFGHCNSTCKKPMREGGFCFICGEIGCVGKNCLQVEDAMEVFEDVYDDDTDFKRIQELDNGFFEKFGSLLKEQASRCESSAVPNNDVDSGMGDDNTPTLSLGEDSEPEDTTNKLITDAMGWNIEELYSEILFEILHNVGCDVESSEEQSEIIRYLQRAFHLEDAKHNSLLEQVRAKEAPNILLNVEIIEAKDLRPKDANGLSDPFCTLYLASAPTHRYNTSVKSETLSPLWEEHFSLPVENPSEDVLWLEVWDFDPAETVREKMTKIMEVKGVRGLRKLMKEIAVTASTGKHDNEFVGSTNISLRSIPASGQTFWCPLEKKTKSKKQGDVKVKLSFSSEKNSQVSSQEYRHLLRLLLLHELETSKVEAYQWSGNFSSLAKDILTQHVVQSGLNSNAVSLAQWIEFSSVHVDHPLSFRLFYQILEKLTRSLQNATMTDEEVKIFWEGTKKLLPSCINGIRKIRKLTASDKNTQDELTAILSICSLLHSVQPPAGVDLFPSAVYGWLNKAEDESNCDIQTVISNAITQGANDWYNYLVEINQEDGTEEGKLRHIIKVITLIRTDIQKAIEFYDKIFQGTLRFSYAIRLYHLYDSKISELAKDKVIEACKMLKPIKFEDTADLEVLSMGTTLFELYLCLQRFAVLGSGLGLSADTYTLSKFHLWFHRGVAQWLDIALYKAMQRIEKAAELDNLKPVDASVKYSSSAVDTLAIFYQIKVFWKQLNWPDVEGSYTFVAKIIDDICRCCVFYADKMTQRVEGLGDNTSTIYDNKFQVTPEWCLAINNIDYVKNSIPTFVNELGMEEIIGSLSELQSTGAADHCKRTLLVIIDNAIETVANKILELQDTVTRKMTPSINRFLLEGAELLNQDCNSVDRLMQYLDENLLVLHNQLNDDNFQGILNLIWDKVAALLYDLVENSLEKRRPPSFFSNLYMTLQILMNFFKKSEEEETDGLNKISVLRQVQHLLRLHGMETWELIQQYHLERVEEQEAQEEAPFGLLTVKAQLINSSNLLRVQLMNARNLWCKDAKGSCDPYVKINLLPEEKFASVPKPKSKTHKKTTFPLYDETFTLQLTPEQATQPDGLIHFVIKDQDFLTNEYISETYLRFSSIQKTDVNKLVEDMPQVHLKLTRPQTVDSNAFKALEHRQGDKLARDFIKKQKSKLFN